MTDRDLVGALWRTGAECPLGGVLQIAIHDQISMSMRNIYPRRTGHSAVQNFD